MVNLHAPIDPADRTNERRLAFHYTRMDEPTIGAGMAAMAAARTASVGGPTYGFGLYCPGIYDYFTLVVCQTRDEDVALVRHDFNRFYPDIQRSNFMGALTEAERTNKTRIALFIRNRFGLGSP